MKIKKLCYVNKVVVFVNRVPFICVCGSFGINKHNSSLILRLAAEHKIYLMKINNTLVRQINGFNLKNLNFLLGSNSIENIVAFLMVLEKYKINLFFQKLVFQNNYIYNGVTLMPLLKMKKEVIWNSFFVRVNSNFLFLLQLVLRSFFILYFQFNLLVKKR